MIIRSPFNMIDKNSSNERSECSVGAYEVSNKERTRTFDPIGFNVVLWVPLAYHPSINDQLRLNNTVAMMALQNRSRSKSPIRNLFDDRSIQSILKGNHMTAFQNTNVVFRCPLTLKQKMRTFAEAEQLHLSAFIRNACVEAMKRSASKWNGQDQ